MEPLRPIYWNASFARKNLRQAWLRVKANGGAAGVDGMTIAQFPAFARQYWPEIRSRLLAGTYHPAPVRRVFIPKPNGDLRPLGIPTVLDRVIQQAIAQVLTPLFDPHFSTHSYGFRHGKRAHQAVRSVQAAAQAGYGYAVDCDLKSFLDRSSYYTLAHGVTGKSCGCWSKARIRKPFCRPRQTWTAESSPRFTRCMIVCRDTPRMRMASGIAT